MHEIMKSLAKINIKGSFSLLLLALLFYLPFNSPGQSYLKVELVNTNCPVSHHQADTWYFGQNAGIDFVGGPAVALTNMFGYNLPQCSAVLSDSTGRLLFYTDGKSVWDRYKNLMPNGTGLAGNPGVTQPAIIIPKPGDDDIYYIFTVDIIRFTSGDTTKNGFRYSEVNMSLNNGNGDVTENKNVELLTEVGSKVTAVQHDNGTDFWVLAHKWNSNEFCAYHVSDGGVNKNYVSSKLGVNHQGDIFEITSSVT